MLNVISVALCISFYLRKCEVVWVESKQMKVIKSFREHLGQPILIIERYLCDAYNLEVDPTFLVKCGTFTCQTHQRFRRRIYSQRQNIDVSSRAIQSVKHRHCKSAQTMQRDFFLERIINFREE